LYLLVFGVLLAPFLVGQTPKYDHVVIVVEENHGYSQIIGSAEAPYFNELANGGALFTASHGTNHPSQPNYLQLFSGSNQGVTTNDTPKSRFSTPNLGSQLISAGLSFKGYAETLPSETFQLENSGGTDGYWRKHNPWINFTNVPMASNRPFSDFPSDFSKLPTVSFVVPNQLHDMHNGTIAQADAWLKTNVGEYAKWALTHNSLLIVTFDEDNDQEDNRIPTIFYGDKVIAAANGEPITHHNVLRTLEDMYGLPHAGNAANVNTIRSPWSGPTVPPKKEVPVRLFLSSCLLGLWFFRHQQNAKLGKARR
jgi:phosphatidylinositol-3-phosphatase